MIAPTVVHEDVVIAERAVLCANGRVHFGPEFLRDRPADEVRRNADEAAERNSARFCGGAPHSLAQRERITTAWKPISP